MNPPMSSPSEGPNIPHWDTTGRWYVDQQQIAVRQLGLWVQLSKARTAWYSEVRVSRGINTWFFTWRRSDALFGDVDDILALMRDLTSLPIPDYPQWALFSFHEEPTLVLGSKLEPNLAACIRTPWYHTTEVPESVLNLCHTRDIQYRKD